MVIPLGFGQVPPDDVEVQLLLICVMLVLKLDWLVFGLTTKSFHHQGWWRFSEKSGIQWVHQECHWVVVFCFSVFSSSYLGWSKSSTTVYSTTAAVRLSTVTERKRGDARIDSDRRSCEEVLSIPRYSKSPLDFLFGQHLFLPKLVLPL